MNEERMFPATANALKNKKHVTASKYFAETNNNAATFSRMRNYGYLSVMGKFKQQFDLTVDCITSVDII